MKKKRREQLSLYSEKIYDTVLDCIPKERSITPRELTQILRKNNEVEVATNLPWQVRKILEDLCERDSLLFDLKTASYKRK